MYQAQTFCPNNEIFTALQKFLLDKGFSWYAEGDESIKTIPDYGPYLCVDISDSGIYQDNSPDDFDEWPLLSIEEFIEFVEKGLKNFLVINSGDIKINKLDRVANIGFTNISFDRLDLILREIDEIVEFARNKDLEITGVIEGFDFKYDGDIIIGCQSMTIDEYEDLVEKYENFIKE